MPRVKIDYIVSFSSEDPEHPANNLLSLEVSKKKWLCAKGETSCSVVLQLPRAVKISSVNIGAYHAALVEVLVGRSESTNEQYQVLVPSCVFLSREESRAAAGAAAAARVRSFSGAQLAQPARDLRWDRLRVICSQPHNKHCQFGLSFVHIDEAESSAPAGATSVPQRLLALDTFSSDEDDFKPGELFAKHLQKTDTEVIPSAHNTGAQIRQATSQALKNISESSTKLMKNPIIKPSGSCNISKPTASVPRPAPRHSAPPADTTGSANTPHRGSAKQSADHNRDSEKQSADHKRDSAKQSADDNRDSEKQSADHNRDSAKQSADHNRDLEKKKRERSGNQERPAVPIETLLSDVTVVLSGYENPRRAAVRRAALALGARVLPAWSPAATHLICAFPNTPKLRAVRAGAGGRAVPAARAEWLHACRARRRRLPWQWFATEPERRRTPPPDSPRRSGSERDTDDEIEEVLREQKKRRPEPSATDRPEVRGGSDSDGATDDDSAPPAAPPPPLGGALAEIFDGCTFSLPAAAARAPAAPRLARYVRAYGGELLDGGAGGAAGGAGGAGGAAGGAGGAHYVLDARGAAWVARCHAAGARLPYP